MGLENFQFTRCRRLLRGYYLSCDKSTGNKILQHSILIDHSVILNEILSFLCQCTYRKTRNYPRHKIDFIRFRNGTQKVFSSFFWGFKCRHKVMINKLVIKLRNYANFRLHIQYQNFPCLFNIYFLSARELVLNVHTLYNYRNL